MDKIAFVVHEEHLKLVPRLYWSLELGDDDDIRIPTVDLKRPLGNSNIFEDIAEILGLELYSDDPSGEMYEDAVEQRKYFRGLFEDLAIVLQIACSTGKFEAGTYVAEKYSNKWSKL